MKLPRLVIAGDSHPTTAYFSHMALKSGFARLTGVAGSALPSLKQDPNVLLIWVAASVENPSQGCLTHPDPFRTCANLVLCCTEAFGLRSLQFSHLLSAINAGDVSSTESDQYWSTGLSKRSSTLSSTPIRLTA